MIERIVSRAGLTAVIGPNTVGQRAGGRRLGVALGGIPFRLSGWVSRTLRSTAYSASKGAVRLFTKSTAIKYASEGIRANSIHPGPIDTAMGDQVWPDADSREASAARTALGRMGTPEDMAYGALYLASEESSFVTGSELVIDGGVTAQ